MGEGEIITSIFSYSCNVFDDFTVQGHKNLELCGEGLTLYQTILAFNDPE